MDIASASFYEERAQNDPNLKEALRLLSDAYDVYAHASDQQRTQAIEQAIQLYLQSLLLHSTAEGHTYLAWMISMLPPNTQVLGSILNFSTETSQSTESRPSNSSSTRNRPPSTRSFVIQRAAGEELSPLILRILNVVQNSEANPGTISVLDQSSSSMPLTLTQLATPLLVRQENNEDDEDDAKDDEEEEPATIPWRSLQFPRISHPGLSSPSHTHSVSPLASFGTSPIKSSGTVDWHQFCYSLAIQHCEQAIHCDPSFGNPYNDIGSYLSHIGRESEVSLFSHLYILLLLYSLFYGLNGRKGVQDQQIDLPLMLIWQDIT